MSRLRTLNPGPLKIIPGARSPERAPRRCDFEDGRGRCRSVETLGFIVSAPGEKPIVVTYYCDRHAAERIFRRASS